KEEADETTRWVEEAGRQAVAVPCDVREEENCRALIDRAVSEFGRIDILVNNAAYQMSQPDGIEAITTEQFDRVLRTNLYGMFWLCKMAVPHIPEGGSIIHSASVQAYKPSPHLLDDATTKGGIVTFTQGLAQMLIERGIRVNAVAPRPVWTPLIPATLPDTTEFGKQTPVGRPAQPAEMAPAYAFLASQEAPFLTAETVNATGGTPLPSRQAPDAVGHGRRTSPSDLAVGRSSAGEHPGQDSALHGQYLAVQRAALRRQRHPHPPAVLRAHSPVDEPLPLQPGDEPGQS